MAWDNEWDFCVVCDELMVRVVAIILRWIFDARAV